MCGGGVDGVVVGAGDVGDGGAFVADGLDGGGVDAVGDEGVRGAAELASEPGDGTAVVAVGRGDDRDRPVARAAVDAVAQGAVDCPGRAEALERGQPEPVGLVLGQDVADPEVAREAGEVGQGGRGVAGQGAVEVPDLGRHGRAGPAVVAGLVGRPGHRSPVDGQGGGRVVVHQLAYPDAGVGGQGAAVPVPVPLGRAVRTRLT